MQTEIFCESWGSGRCSGWLMELEAQALCGAKPHERSEDRVNQRNGYRPRQLETRIGTMDLKIPKLRHGSYLPAFLDPRKASERALVAVVQVTVPP